MATRILSGQLPIGRAPSIARPPYLNGLIFEDRQIGGDQFADLIVDAPSKPIDLDLAGQDVRLFPGQATEFVESAFDDHEALLTMHRFAWIPALGSACDPAWVGVIWQAWMQRYGQSSDGWAWHPYTVAERLINLLAFAEVHGYPTGRQQTQHVLSRHGKAIYDGLEYFGSDGTGNHLANNGRGLFLGGLRLGFSHWADLGERILIEEADRLFTKSGLLREGSSHYHLLLTRWYIEAWLAARRYGRASKDILESIAARSSAVARRLLLPGGLPLIGDVSPDCRPDYLTSLAGGSSGGWLSTLSCPDRVAVEELASIQSEPASLLMAADGWLRVEAVPWTMLAHAAPNGWHPMPGHAHNDFGGFELHHNTSPVIRDFGRRSYGEPGKADIDAASHSTLTIDGQAAYPFNRPYYSDAFRFAVRPPPTQNTWAGSSAAIQTDAFRHLTNIGSWRRSWRASDDAFTISDRVEGNGRRTIARYLHTTLPVEVLPGAVRFGSYMVTFDGRVELYPSRRWYAYGRSEPATSLKIVIQADLPWQSTITVRSPLSA